MTERRRGIADRVTQAPIAVATEERTRSIGQQRAYLRDAANVQRLTRLKQARQAAKFVFLATGSHLVRCAPIDLVWVHHPRTATPPPFP